MNPESAMPTRTDEQGQHEILDPDHFMVGTEDVFANETFRRFVHG